MICSYSRDGSASLASIDLNTLVLTPIATEFTEIGSLCADADYVYFVGASHMHFPAIVKLAPSSGQVTILKSSNTQDVHAYDGYLSSRSRSSFRRKMG